MAKRVVDDRSGRYVQGMEARVKARLAGKFSQHASSRKHATAKSIVVSSGDYGRLVSDISGLLEQARRGAARSVNAILTAAYWEIGRRIVEHEQGGKAKAEYGEFYWCRLPRI